MPISILYAFICTRIASSFCLSRCIFLLTMILLFTDKKILIYRIVVARAVFAQFLSIDKAPTFRILRFNPHASTDLEAYLNEI